MSLFYLSFCDVNKPKGQQFLGATIVAADDAMEAVAKSHRLGINPGGEVAIVEFEPDEETDHSMMAKYVNAFVPREEVFRDGAVPLSEVTGDEEEAT